LVGNFDTVTAIGLPNPTFDVFTRVFGQTLLLQIFSFASAVGADFNGDGIVDDLDLIIWRQNVGTPGPAGDANGDGIVNGRDFFIWQMQVGGPGMGAGSGSSFGGGGAVPEPTSFVLIACGAMLALALRRPSRQQ
jgi:hypothetical protein